ncbi:MAG: hypothetical protein IJZ08_05250 [Clostridia bacterium]|nr:hypothetical protein [Clostridia bacterium]
MNEQSASAGRGYLRVIVRKARETLPIEGAFVRIYSGEAGEGSVLLYSLRTNEDGITDTVQLTAPPAALSMKPGDPAPYGVYNITVQKDGYGTVENVGVPIFDGVISTQPVQLIPLSEFRTDGESELRIFETPTGENPLL